MSLNKRKTMFGKAKHPGLAKTIEFDTPAHARKAASKLVHHFNELERRDAKVATKRATVQAANRAGAMLGKKNLSAKERKEMRQIHGIYRKAHQRMKLE